MYHPVTPHPVAPAASPQRGGVARLWYELGPGSRRRRLRARADAQRVAALRADWQISCHHVGLGLRIHTPSGVTVSVPRLVRADFGPPVVSFTVLLRPGQRAADLIAAEPRLALALGAAGLFVTELRDGWVKVVVVDDDFRKVGNADGFRSGEPRVPDLEVV